MVVNGQNALHAEQLVASPLCGRAQQEALASHGASPNVGPTSSKCLCVCVDMLVLVMKHVDVFARQSVLMTTCLHVSAMATLTLARRCKHQPCFSHYA